MPISSRYISKWTGDPKVSYISFHFIFDIPGVFIKNRNFKLQKIKSEDVPSVKTDFESVLAKFDGEESGELMALSRFFKILGGILPLLKTEKVKQVDARILKATEYIENNYREEISVSELALHVI